MNNLLDFWSHPKNVCMSYVSHFQFSLFLSYKFGIASFKALIHAIIPNLFISSSTDITREINKIISVMGCNNHYDKVTTLKN